MADATKLTKKIDRRNAAIIVAIVIIVLLLLLGKRAMNNTIVNRGGLSFNGGGDNFDFNIGDINIPGITIPDLSVYDQQSSCGCSIATAEIQGNNGPVYYAPAKVKSITETRLEIQTLYVTPPAPPKPKGGGIGFAWA